MKLIKSSVQILNPTGYTIKDIYKSIELASRTCYKSENLITEDSAEKFVNMIKDRQHTAMLEHGTVYLHINWPYRSPSPLIKYSINPYSITKYVDNTYDIYVTTNYRVLYENNWLDDLQYLCEPTEYHEKRLSVRFICDRGILAEFTRHRMFSFAAESTRYCNYSKSKFNNEITFIIPCWTNIPEGDYGSRVHPKIVQRGWHDGIAQIFINNCRYSEESYFQLLNEGWTPQQARSVLPNSLKTELIMTGTVEQWKGFFKLRCDKAAHPQARELAIPLKEEFIKMGLLHDN